MQLDYFGAAPPTRTCLFMGTGGTFRFRSEPFILRYLGATQRGRVSLCGVIGSKLSPSCRAFLARIAPASTTSKGFVVEPQERGLGDGSALP